MNIRAFFPKFLLPNLGYLDNIPIIVDIYVLMHGYNTKDAKNT